MALCDPRSAGSLGHGALAFWTAVGYPRDHHIVRHVGTMASLEGAEGLRS